MRAGPNGLAGCVVREPAANIAAVEAPAPVGSTIPATNGPEHLRVLRRDVVVVAVHQRVADDDRAALGRAEQVRQRPHTLRRPPRRPPPRPRYRRRSTPPTAPASTPSRRPWARTDTSAPSPFGSGTGPSTSTARRCLATAAPAASGCLATPGRRRRSRSRRRSAATCRPRPAAAVPSPAGERISPRHCSHSVYFAAQIRAVDRQVHAAGSVTLLIVSNRQCRSLAIGFDAGLPHRRMRIPDQRDRLGDAGSPDAHSGCCTSRHDSTQPLTNTSGFAMALQQGGDRLAGTARRSADAATAACTCSRSGSCRGAVDGVGVSTTTWRAGAARPRRAPAAAPAAPAPRTPPYRSRRRRPAKTARRRRPQPRPRSGPGSRPGAV